MAFDRPGSKPIVLSMRMAVRLLFCLAISWSLALAVMPARASAPQVKAGCCAQMAKDAAANDCGQHAPKSNDEKQCCSMCAFCVALLSATTPFVYSPSGKESFPEVSAGAHVRSDRPAVPPPRRLAV